MVVRAESFSLCLAELSALFCAAFLAVEDSDHHPSMLKTLKLLAAAQSDGTFPEVAVQSTGARSLFAFDGDRWRDRLRWKKDGPAWPMRFAPPLPRVTRLSYASPFEIIISVSLTGYVTVSGFTLFLNAVRKVYREVKMFDVDRAELDAVKAQFAAAEAQAVRSKAEDEQITAIATQGLEERLSPASRAALSLDSMEAHVEHE